MIVGAEITSVLQCLFVLSLLNKKFNLYHIEIHLLIFNIEVNDSTIKGISDIFDRLNCNYKIIDLRKYYFSKKIIEKKGYEMLILRSRIDTNFHNIFSISKNYFITTGNCNNMKKYTKDFYNKNIYTVDDGLSNWKNLKHNYLRILAMNLSLNSVRLRNVILPTFFNFLFPKDFFIKHYSIYSKSKKINLLDDFRFIVNKLNKNIKLNKQIENLYIGIWPNFKDRSNKLNKDKQLDYFVQFLKKSKLNEKTIYIKDHPKLKINLRTENNNLLKLKGEEYNLPVEVLIPSFPKLKNIYTFPSSFINLINIIYNKNDFIINVLYLENDYKYFGDRKKLIKKNKNIKFIKLN